MYSTFLPSQLPAAADVSTILSHFCGEPDGGLAFPGQVIPFIVVEVGVSDSATKTNGRMEHWLRRASGHVLIALLTSLMAR